MNKELFVSSTPHETKVGLVEDDLLAEIYLERENEYTLAGSIYKGRVTRVLPGMQSAFVDIGLERDAFLYVSDFMELEEHDEDLTDVVPANRGVQDMRPQLPREESVAGEAQLPAGQEAADAETFGNSSAQDFAGTEEHSEAQPLAGAAPDSSSGGVSQDRERGGYRGRRRRRGGRRDGRGDARGDSRGDSRGDGRDRGSEPRFTRPATETPAAPVTTFAPAAPRQESARSQQFGPPAGYQPILLPGESISKYRGLAQPASMPERRFPDTGAGTRLAPAATPASEPAAPLAATFPEDEPIFASASEAAETSGQRDDIPTQQDRGIQAAASESSTAVDWNREFHRQDAVGARAPVASDEAAQTPAAQIPAAQIEEEFVEEDEEMVSAPEQHTQPATSARDAEAPVFAAPGTLEEETIDEEEADTVRYQESSDEGYDEFEEETRAAGQIAEVRATVDEIHMASLAEAGITPSPDASAAEGEEDSEELELEEAQAEAEALLD